MEKPRQWKNCLCTVLLLWYCFRQGESQTAGWTWLDRARVTEPWLFAITYDWPFLPGTKVDLPTQESWRVAKTALQRWPQRLDFEIEALGVGYEVIVLTSNGAYTSDGLPGRTYS